MRTIRKIIHITTFFIILLSMFTVTTTASEDILRIADEAGDIGFPTPFGHYPRGEGYIRMSLIFDTLVWKDADGIIPALADTWSYDESDNSYIFHLNTTAQWHDGVDITAEDVRFSLDYYRQHPYMWVDLANVETCQVVDQNTVKIILKEPYAPFLTEIGQTMPILPEHIWKDVDNPENFMDEKALIGSGPYILKDYSRVHGTYLYQANQEYYLGIPKFDQVSFIKVNDGQISLQNGDVDMAAIKPEAVEILEQNGFITLSDTYSLNYKLMINHNRAPLNSKEFRHALAFAINRSELVEKAERGHGIKASLGFLPPNSDWFSDSQPTFDYEPEKATAIIESQGYQLVDGFYEKEGEKLQLELLSTNRESRQAEIIKKQLENVGIKTIVTILDWATLDSQVMNWNFDIAIIMHGGISGDPKSLYDFILHDSLTSARYNKSAELNARLEEQLHEIDREKRMVLINEIQELCANELPAITLYYPTWYYAFNDKQEWYFTKEGVAKGIPTLVNKMSLIQDADEPTQPPLDPSATKAEPTPHISILLVCFLLFIAYLIKQRS